MKIFFDTSSLVKRFVEEKGSQEADEICQKASELGLSIICFPEIISALNRKLRSEMITKATYLALKNEVLEDIADADIINLTPSVLKKTTQLLEANVLHSLDAIHLAYALEWKAELFVTSDEKQAAAAINSSLSVKYIEGFNSKH